MNNINNNNLNLPISEYERKIQSAERPLFGQLPGFFADIAPDINIQIFSLMDMPSLHAMRLVSKDVSACAYIYFKEYAIEQQEKYLSYKDLYEMIASEYKDFLAGLNDTWPAFSFSAKTVADANETNKAFESWARNEFKSFIHIASEDFVEYLEYNFDRHFIFSSGHYLPEIANMLLPAVVLQLQAMSPTAFSKSVPALSKVAVDTLILKDIPLSKIPESVLANPMIYDYYFENNQINLRELYDILVKLIGHGTVPLLVFEKQDQLDFSLCNKETLEMFVKGYQKNNDAPSEEFYAKYFIPSAIYLLGIYKEQIFGNEAKQWENDNDVLMSFDIPPNFPKALPANTVNALLGRPYDKTENPFAIFIPE